MIEPRHPLEGASVREAAGRLVRDNVMLRLNFTRDSRMEFPQTDFSVEGKLVKKQGITIEYGRPGYSNDSPLHYRESVPALVLTPDGLFTAETVQASEQGGDGGVTAPVQESLKPATTEAYLNHEALLYSLIKDIAIQDARKRGRKSSK